MKIGSNHFKIAKHKDYLLVIKENISLVHNVYTNDPLNMYLVLGTSIALLLDTGCGLYPLKPIVDNLIGNRKLMVINTHTHWDHILGNEEFGGVYVHENEAKIISKPYDVSYFEDSPNEIVKVYAEKKFLIAPAKEIKILKDGDIFDLGGIEVQVIHTPGHSPGSICLLTSKGELFTSDVAYYGDQFLPIKKKFSLVLNTLSKLVKLCQSQGIVELYPSHRRYPCDVNLLIDLYNGIKNIENIWNTKVAFDFFQAWQIDDPSGQFRYYIAR